MPGKVLQKLTVSVKGRSPRPAALRPVTNSFTV